MILIVFALNWYVNSSWWCWWFGNSFGGRAFLDFSLVFVAGLAFALELGRDLEVPLPTTAITK